MLPFPCFSTEPEPGLEPELVLEPEPAPGPERSWAAAAAASAFVPGAFAAALSAVASEITAPFYWCPTESVAAGYLEAFAFGWRNCSSYSADLPWAGSSSWATLGFVAGGIAC